MAATVAGRVGGGRPDHGSGPGETPRGSGGSGWGVAVVGALAAQGRKQAGQKAGSVSLCPLRGVYEPAVRALQSWHGKRVLEAFSRCPPVVVAARAAVARTPLAAHLRRKTLPTKLLAVGAMAAVVNVPFGMLRYHTEKYSPQWVLAVHASVPFVSLWRKAATIPKVGIAFTIGAAILGQAMGAELERERLALEAALREKREERVSYENRENEKKKNGNGRGPLTNTVGLAPLGTEFVVAAGGRPEGWWAVLESMVGVRSGGATS